MTLLLIMSSLEIMLVSFNSDNNRPQTVSKGFCCGTAGQAGCHPKASGSDKFGIRIKNELWQIKKGNIRLCGRCWSTVRFFSLLSVFCSMLL